MTGPMPSSRTGSTAALARRCLPERGDDTDLLEDSRLGGLRIGWGYARREMIDVLNRIRQPFNLSTATTRRRRGAIRDTAFAEWCRSENARLREWLRAALARAGVATDVSHTNFVLARFGDAAKPTPATRTCAATDHCPPCRRLRLPNCLRMTVGDEVGCHRLAASVAAFMEGGGERHLRPRGADRAWAQRLLHEPRDPPPCGSPARS